MAAVKKINLDFFESTLSAEETKRAEFTGMLILAADFIKKGYSLKRISKASVPIYLSKTKSGDYVALNPSSSEVLKVQLMQLPSLGDITTFVSEPKNLNLDKIYKELLKFETEEAQLLGGYGNKQISVMEELLRTAPRALRNDFPTLPPIGDQATIKTQLQQINNLVYDEKSLDKAIADRFDIIEQALEEEVNNHVNKYNEREAFWKAEIENAHTNLQKKLKDRDKQLQKEIKELEKETKKKIKNALSTFLKGTAKNIRKDEKPLEAQIVKLETVAQKSPDMDIIPEIEKLLKEMKDQTNMLISDFDFQLRKIRTLYAQEQEFNELMVLDTKGLENRAERDKAELIEESKHLESNRDAEMNKLKELRDQAKQKLAQFRDRKNNWIADIKTSLGGRSTPMIPASALKVENPAKQVEVLIPIYIFQYKNEKNDAEYSIIVPPMSLPNSMKKPIKGAFMGDNKTVQFIPLIKNSEIILDKWFAKAYNDINMRSNVQNLDNILSDPTTVRNAFFDSQSLFLDKLQVKKKNLAEANKRLTTAFST